MFLKRLERGASFVEILQYGDVTYEFKKKIVRVGPSIRFNRILQELLEIEANVSISKRHLKKRKALSLSIEMLLPLAMKNIIY